MNISADTTLTPEELTLLAAILEKEVDFLHGSGSIIEEDEHDTFFSLREKVAALVEATR